MKRLLIVALLTASAFAAKQSFTSSDIFEIRNVGDPEISSDGKSVLYTVNWADKMNDAFYSNVWVAGADGNGQRVVSKVALSVRRLGATHERDHATQLTGPAGKFENIAATHFRVGKDRHGQALPFKGDQVNALEILHADPVAHLRQSLAGKVPVREHHVRDFDGE